MGLKTYRGVGSGTIQEGHTRWIGHRGGRAQDHTGGPYKTERAQRGSGPGPYGRAIHDGEGTEGVGPRRGHRGGPAQDHTGGPEEEQEEEEEGGREEQKE